MGHRNPTSQQRSTTEAIAMNEVKGKARTQGTPVSNRTDEFKAGSVLWDTPAGGFSTAWGSTYSGARHTLGR